MAETKPLSLKDAQNLVRGSSNPFSVLSRVRGRVKFADLQPLVAWLPTVRHDGRGVFQGHYPTQVGELRRQSILQPVGLDREATWARLIFTQQATRLEAFLRTVREYEQEIALGHNDRAMSVLDTIERDFGASLWVIENRIALLQLVEGLDKQKAYLSLIRGQSKSNLVSFIAFYISSRNEEAITPARFAARLIEQLKPWKIEHDLLAYLRFRVANEDPLDDAAAAAILRHETTSAIVDQYDSFVRVAQAVALHGTEGAQRRFLVELRKLDSILHDIRIKKVLFLLGAPGEWPTIFSARDLAPISAVARGDFEELSRAATRARLADPTDSSVWFLEAQAAAERGLPPESDDGSLRARVTAAAYSIITRAPDSHEATVTLSRLALNFTLLSFTKEIGLFLDQHVSSDPIPNRVPVLCAFLHSPCLELAALRYLQSPEQQKQYVDTLCDVYGAPPALLAEILRSGLDPSPWGLNARSVLSSTTMAEIETERLLSLRAYPEALHRARDLRLADSAIARRRGARYEAFCLIKSGRTDEAIDLVVRLYLGDSGIIPLLPIRECGESLDKAARKRLAAKLSTSIVLDLYSRYIDDRLDNIRAYAYEDFLIANGMERPAQLAGRAGDYDADELIYYLRHLCVPAIMQVSSVFRGTKDVEEERLQIASLLAKIDPISIETYETEIREIKRNQLIERGVRHVEQTKIFADFAAIRKWAERELRDSFSRYQALLRAGVGGEEAAFTKAIQDALGGAPIPQEFLELPKNEAIDLLISMVYTLFLECTINPEYGLDCYLSMRIRHGTLSGQLRSPLERERIITQRNELREYAPNEYWIQRLTHLDWQVRKRIDDRLQKFSAAYDAFIDRIANELVQIRSNDKKHGVFQTVDDSAGYRLVGIRSVRFRIFVGDIKPSSTFEEFLELCFSLFWESVEPCLTEFRALIDSVLKPEVNALFTQLEGDLPDISAFASTADLDRAVRTAQTGAQQALDRVKEWFRPPQPTAVPDFSFEELVDIGLQCVRAIHADFDPILVQEVPPLPAIKGLVFFSDIFFIVFDNIRRHSGISPHPRVMIEVDRLENRLSILIHSEVAPSARTDNAEGKVARIRQSIVEGDYQRAVRLEGGTGLIKLRRIIGTLPLDFGFTGEDEFFVKFEVGIFDIEVQEIKQ